MITGGDTKQRIIDVAERLFAQRGVEQTSTRDITAAAEVNVAAVNYHFGGREGLLRAVLDRTIEPLNARRFELLDLAVAEHGDPVPVEALLRAFVLPDLECLVALGAERFELARFIGRCYAQPSPEMEWVIRRQFSMLAERFYPMLQAAAPDVAPQELEFRMGLVVGVVVNLFETARPAVDGTLIGLADPRNALERLVRFLSPGIAAPSPLSSMATI